MSKLRALLILAQRKKDHLAGSFCFLVGLGFTIYLGVLSGAEKQPTRATSALLVVLAALFQGMSASYFRKIGRADPSLARATVRRLIKMGIHAQAARQAAETAFETSSGTEAKKAMGLLSVELSWIEEGLTEAVQDWNEFHEDALRELKKGPTP